MATLSACGRFGFDTAPPFRDSLTGEIGQPDSRVCNGTFCCIENLEPSSGDIHGCVRKVDGTIWCWGNNNEGEVGNGFMSDVGTPIRVIGIPPAAQVVTGHQHTCMRGVDETVWCWGDNTFGQLGVANLGSSPSPVQVPIDRVTFLASGNEHVCAIREDFALQCWGSTTLDRHIPSVTAFGTVVAVAAGEHGTCAYRPDGTMWCAGDNVYGQLGTGMETFVPEATPLQVQLTDVMAISPGDGHTCAQKTDGSVYCWGRNGDDDLGIGVPSALVATPTMNGLTCP